MAEPQHDLVDLCMCSQSVCEKLVCCDNSWVRLLTGQLEGFAAEDAAVLHAGLVSSSDGTVDNTSDRHPPNSGYATHIGGRTLRLPHDEIKSKSQFSLRLGSHPYVLTEAASAMAIKSIPSLTGVARRLSTR